MTHDNPAVRAEETRAAEEATWPPELRLPNKLPETPEELTSLLKILLGRNRRQGFLGWTALQGPVQDDPAYDNFRLWVDRQVREKRISPTCGRVGILLPSYTAADGTVDIAALSDAAALRLETIRKQLHNLRVALPGLSLAGLASWPKP
jgi:hypothetical protein